MVSKWEGEKRNEAIRERRERKERRQGRLMVAEEEVEEALREEEAKIPKCFEGGGRRRC